MSPLPGRGREGSLLYLFLHGTKIIRTHTKLLHVTTSKEYRRPYLTQIVMGFIKWLKPTNNNNKILLFTSHIHVENFWKWIEFLAEFMIELFTVVLSSVFYFTLSCTLAASSDVSNALNNSIIIQLRHVVRGIKINVNIKT